MAEIKTKRGDVILVDDEDFEFAANYNWNVGSGGYARRNKRRGDPEHEGATILLHRQLMGLAYGDAGIVDHINGNRLDNRRANLRLCNRSENTRNQKKRSTNTSGYKGVCFHKGCQKWGATIHYGGRQRHIGMFDTPELAYAAYCDAARRHHGEFANVGIECQ